MKDSLYVVIAGCGRLGSDLANLLSRVGHSVVVIDLDPSSFDDLSPDFSGFKVEGDATSINILKQAKLEKADVMLAATHEDNANLLLAQVAHKIFSVPRVLARVYDPGREQIYRRLGIETICPTSVAALKFLEMIQAGSP